MLFATLSSPVIVATFPTTSDASIAQRLGALVENPSRRVAAAGRAVASLMVEPVMAMSPPSGIDTAAGVAVGNDGVA